MIGCVSYSVFIKSVMMYCKSVFYCSCYLLVCANAFNLFPKHAHIFTSNDTSSYFGYSVLLRSAGGKGSSHIIVGSPRSNSTFTSLHGKIVEPGAVFTCSFDDNECSQFLFDPNGNTLHRAPNGMTYHHRKDHGWLGASLDGVDTVGGLLVACAPRWINQIYKDIYYLQNGICYLLKDTSNIEKTAEELIPLVYAGNQGFKNGSDHVYYYALGEAGMSAHLTKVTNIKVPRCPGMIVKYYDSAPSTGVVSQKSNLKSANFDDFLSPNPFYISKIEDFSYFGYAVSSGHFIKNSDKVWYVGGAPRGKNLFGQVLVYEYINFKDDLLIHFEMSGRQQGEYFGSALTVADINNDAADDIIIGAPIYSTDRYFDVGCIYVFINNGKGIFSRTIIDGPQISRIRFGSAVSNIGDINHDGFADIAVGAPYYNNDQGAIYIYMGSEKGLEEGYSQRILAADVDTNLRGFGISISKGVDIDSNYYPDIAVGAYLSGHAVVIKTKPVAKIIASISSSNKRISINTKTFNISICFQYDGVYVPSIINIKIRINADPFYKRVFFTQNRGGMWNNVKQLRHKLLQCEDLNITVSSIKSDFTQPIQFQMTYGLADSTNEGRFCSTCPILDERSSNTTYLNIPFQINCGDDNLCQPDLKLEAKFNHKEPYFVIGSRKELDISVSIKNSGEPAFLCRFYVTIPESISFEKIPNICQQSTNQVLICNMGNPLSINETKSLSLRLDVSSLSNKDLLEIKMNVTSVGSEINIKDNAVTLVLPLKTQAHLSVIGMSDPEQFTFVDENEMFKQDNFTFHQQFSVQNLGPSPLDELQLNILVPYMFGSSTESILQIYEPEVSLDDNSLTCTTTNKEGFYVDKINDKPTNMFGDDFIKTQTRSKRSMELLDPNISSSNVHSKMEKVVASDPHLPQGLPLNRTLSLSCISSNVDVTCFEVKCMSGPLRKLQNPATVKFKLTVNLKILDEIRGEKDIIVVSSSMQPVSKYIEVNATYAHTVLLGSLRSESITKWLILGCLLGLLLLCAIIFGLYKAGFFKRTAHEKLMNEKEENLIEDTEQNTSD